MNKAASTQHFLNIAIIQDDVLVLKNGELRQILEVTSLNFALKSEEEQNAIIYQYQAFLNGLQFPIQILAQSRRLDLAPYLNKLRQQSEQTPTVALRAQTADYIDFVDRLISLGNIMEKRFYVVVPYSSPSIRDRNILSQFLKRQTVQIESKVFNEAKSRLAERASLIRSSLSTLGLSVKPLSNQDIAQLLYRTYNPVEADEIATTPEIPTPQ